MRELLCAVAGGLLALLPALAQESTFVPINAHAYRFRHGGEEQIFVHDEDEPNLLHGDDPWNAELDGRRALVMAESAGKQRGFMFFDGYLRKMLRNGREINVPLPPSGGNPDAIAALWPPREKRLLAVEPPDIWSDGSRLRLWFDNPNKAGLLFAELALAALALVFCTAIWGRILGGILSLMAFVGLVQTSSRGALLAFLCGLFAMLLVRAKSLFNMRRLMLIVLAGVLAVGCLFVSGQGDRLVKNLFNEGQRETSRLTIWKEVPRMMVDAPGGWGTGQSARAYIDWYQPKNVCLLKDLISGHLTFLVESGWVLRFVYVFLWLAVGLVLTWFAVCGGSPVPLALVVAFAVAGCFNPVISVPELWVVPVVIVLALSLWRGGRWLLSRKIFVPLSAAALCALMALGIVWIWGANAVAEVSVRKTGNAVCLNGASPSIWIVDDDYVLHGGYWWFFGRELRTALKRNGTVSLGYLRSVSDLPSQAEKIVLIGEMGRDFLAKSDHLKARKVVFISPPFSWQAIPASLLSSCEVSLVAGELAVRQAVGTEQAPPWVEILPGLELFIPEWQKFML